MNFIIILLILCGNICVSFCESDDCSKFQTCGECIGYASDICVWCSEEARKGPRCQSKAKLKDIGSWCKKSDIFDPQVKIYNVTDNEFNAGEKGPNIVQFKPQLMNIEARLGVPIKIMMSYKPAKDYPLDIYYLNDFSNTMVDHTETLKKNGENIYDELIKHTNNVQFGVGSFVDKNSLPYADPFRHNSYAFKNELALTDNMTNFVKVLEKKPSGANNDEPEASLDALMQALVCKEQIGWRDNARKIIVLRTDSTYHRAGDGKFVGATRPHDMQCHVTDNKYTMDLELDYPSVGQINKIATEKNIMIIFAVHDKVKYHYTNLVKNILGSKYVPLITDHTLAETIKDEYLSLIRKVQLDSIVPPFMKLTLDKDCSKEGECDLKHHESINFIGTLTVNSCPPDGNYKQKVQIGPAMLNEKLTIQVEIHCQCDCEKPGNGIVKSKLCDKAGTYQCGVCKCDEDRSGPNCTCDVTLTNNQDENSCKQDDSSRICNDRGKCSCGKCSCLEGFSGTYCEYDHTSCYSPKGLLCSDHGSCEKGVCDCWPGWEGGHCGCPVNKDICKPFYSDKICSGNGDCICGECKCNKCSGQFCDDCEEFAQKRCKEYEDYAYCNTKEDKETCDLKYNQTNADVIIVTKTEINSPEYYMAKYWCKKELEDNHILMFKYYFTSSTRKLNIIIQKELEMLPGADVWLAVGSVIGTIIIIGLITLVIWKVLVDLNDKREYEKFMKKSDAEGYDVTENPVYNSPNQHFRNPAYDSHNQ